MFYPRLVDVLWRSALKLLLSQKPCNILSCFTLQTKMIRCIVLIWLNFNISREDWGHHMVTLREYLQTYVVHFKHQVGIHEFFPLSSEIHSHTSALQTGESFAVIKNWLRSRLHHFFSAGIPAERHVKSFLSISLSLEETWCGASDSSQKRGCCLWILPGTEPSCVMR